MKFMMRHRKQRWMELAGAIDSQFVGQDIGQVFVLLSGDVMCIYCKEGKRVGRIKRVV
jgi:hypothetical protein